MLQELMQRVGPKAVDLGIEAAKQLASAWLTRRLMAGAPVPTMDATAVARPTGCPYCKIADALAISIGHLERAPHAGAEYPTHVALALRKLEPAVEQATDLPATMEPMQLTLQKKVLELQIALSKPIGPAELLPLITLAKEAQRLAFVLAERDNRERNRLDELAQEMEAKVAGYDDVIEGKGREIQ